MPSPFTASRARAGGRRTGLQYFFAILIGGAAFGAAAAFTVFLVNQVSQGSAAQPEEEEGVRVRLQNPEAAGGINEAGAGAADSPVADTREVPLLVERSTEGLVSGASKPAIDRRLLDKAETGSDNGSERSTNTTTAAGGAASSQKARPAAQAAAPPKTTEAEATGTDVASSTSVSAGTSDDPEEQIRKFIQNLRVSGVMVAGTRSKAIAEGSVLSPGTVVMEDPALTLTRIEPERLIFQDAEGRRYIKEL
jgi:hypothetical protein